MTTDWLPVAKRPRLIDAMVSCTFTVETKLTFSTSASLAALLYPETDNGDLMLIGDEVCRLTGVSSGSYTAARAAIRCQNLPHGYAHAGGQTHSAAMANYGGGGLHPRPDACLALAAF